MISRKQLTLKPTRHGLLFLVILGAMLGGSVNYNNNAGFVLVFLLGGMALISLFHTVRNLSGLEIAFVSAPPVFAGQPAVFHLKLSAGKFDRASVAVGLSGGDRRFVTLRRGDERSLGVDVPTKRRGMIRPGVLRLQSVYPFGLFRISSRIPVGMGCLAYPAPIAGDGRMSRGGRGMDGEVETRDPGPDDFHGLVPYQPGHDVARIAWKAVSRGRGLFVKDFAAKADQFRILDFDAFSSTDTEYRLSRLCSLILSAHSQNASYGLKLRGVRFDPASGNAHKTKCLRAIALFEPEKRGGG